MHHIINIIESTTDRIALETIKRREFHEIIRYTVEREIEADADASASREFACNEGKETPVLETLETMADKKYWCSVEMFGKVNVATNGVAMSVRNVECASVHV